MSETIEREWCPKCGKAGFYNLGNLDDCSVADYDGAKCPWCGHVWLFEGVDEELSIEDAYIVEGTKEVK